MARRDAILKLMDAVDAYLPEPERALDKPFSMPVEDVFSIQGRGTVVTGRIEQGVIKSGEVRGTRWRELALRGCRGCSGGWRRWVLPAGCCKQLSCSASSTLT